jgi:ABC-type amino acid transport substrate-binding protein
MKQKLMLSLGALLVLLIPAASANAQSNQPPYYIQLQDGTHCTFAGGATFTAIGLRTGYNCGTEDPHANEWLLGLPDQYGQMASATLNVPGAPDSAPPQMGYEYNVTVSPCTVDYRGAATV